MASFETRGAAVSDVSLWSDCHRALHSASRKHLLPLGKGLNVKTRSLGKYDLLLPLAKALFKNGHVSKKEDNINYKNIKRNQIKVVTDVNSLISSKSGDSIESEEVEDGSSKTHV